MAWTTPSTYVAGAILTAASLNTNVRDNTGFLFKPPMCVVSRASQVFANATSANVEFTTETVDTDSMHVTTPAATATRITIVTAGVYIFTAGGVWATTAGRKVMQILKNGVAVSVSDIDTGAGQVLSFTGSAVATDYFQVLGYQASGGGIAMTDAHFGATWQGNPA